MRVRQGLPNRYYHAGGKPSVKSQVSRGWRRGCFPVVVVGAPSLCGIKDEHGSRPKLYSCHFTWFSNSPVIPVITVT